MLDETEEELLTLRDENRELLAEFHRLNNLVIELEAQNRFLETERFK